MGNSQKDERVIIYDSELRDLFEEGAKKQGVSISEYAKNIVRYAVKNMDTSTDISNARYGASNDNEYHSALMEFKTLNQQIMREIAPASSRLNQFTKSLVTRANSNESLTEDEVEALFDEALAHAKAVGEAYSIAEKRMQDYIEEHKE